MADADESITIAGIRRPPLRRYCKQLLVTISALSLFPLNRRFSVSQAEYGWMQLFRYDFRSSSY